MMATIAKMRCCLALFFLMLFVPAIAHAQMVDHPVIKIQTLDKITARTMTFEAHVGSTVKFGPLFIKIRACRKAPPIETPESAAFLQIWEITPKEETKWVFSGWMFASSPALSPMDHPIYDVWILDCLEAKTGAAGVMTEDELEGEDEHQDSSATDKANDQDASGDNATPGESDKTPESTAETIATELE